jgi:GT2 family glycosyltransferase
LRDKPSVSIIILNYNGGVLLRDCLLSVFRTGYPHFEVVVVDNASDDNSVELAMNALGDREHFRIVRSKFNLGFGPANNYGYLLANGDYIVFLNNDTTVDPSWLDALVDAMERDQSIGLAQSLLFDYDSDEIQSAGWLLSDFFVALFPMRFTNQVNLSKLPRVFPISFAQGASMIIRRDLIDQIGLFDPKYFWFYDDTYLSFKVWLMGKRVVTVLDSKVYHVGGGTAGCDSLPIRWRNTAHFISLIFDVYWDSWRLVAALFIFNYNLGIMTIKEILERRKTTRFWSNFYAASWILKNFGYIWKRRLEYKRLAKVTQSGLLSELFKVRLPSSIYLVPSPSKLLWFSLNVEAEKYQANLVSEKKNVDL